MPTPVPVPTAISSVWSGKASETAVSAFSDNLATKITVYDVVQSLVPA